ncbi:hypothetical protein F52700_4923 [Fusarium sp. NRRL 52700]|nr:hypothetical protein F52700_4923 [Fusarium sp. NRRL 52700]
MYIVHTINAIIVIGITALLLQGSLAAPTSQLCITKSTNIAPLQSTSIPTITKTRTEVVNVLVRVRMTRVNVVIPRPTTVTSSFVTTKYHYKHTDFYSIYNNYHPVNNHIHHLDYYKYNLDIFWHNNHSTTIWFCPYHIVSAIRHPLRINILTQDKRSDYLEHKDRISENSHGFQHLHTHFNHNTLSSKCGNYNNYYNHQHFSFHYHANNHDLHDIDGHVDNTCLHRKERCD